MIALEPQLLIEVLDRFDFSGVVQLCRGDETIFLAARGLATPRWRVPNAPGTRFDTASITKLFTSVACLQLVGAGKLDLDVSIHSYVDLQDTAISPLVTLRHLLTHNSGITDDADEEDDEDYAALFVDRPCYSINETADFLPQFADKPPRAAPGTECRYCNVGFILAGLAIERASGLTYRSYVTREVFNRAGMVGAGFFDRREAEPDVAEGWDPKPDGGWLSNIFSYPPIGSPDGGAHATTADLLRFLKALRQSELLSPDLTDMFFRPQIRHKNGLWFGFGLEFDGSDYGKDGVNAGVSARLGHYAAAGVDAAVLSNSKHGAWPVVAELDRLFRLDRVEPLP